MLDQGGERQQGHSNRGAKMARETGIANLLDQRAARMRMAKARSECKHLSEGERARSEAEYWSYRATYLWTLDHPRQYLNQRS